MTRPPREHQRAGHLVEVPAIERIDSPGLIGLLLELKLVHACFHELVEFLAGSHIASPVTGHAE